MCDLAPRPTRPGVLLDPRADQERGPAAFQDRGAEDELARAVVGEDVEEPLDALRRVSASVSESGCFHRGTYRFPCLGRSAIRLALGEEPAVDRWP